MLLQMQLHSQWSISDKDVLMMFSKVKCKVWVIDNTGTYFMKDCAEIFSMGVLSFLSFPLLLICCDDICSEMALKSLIFGPIMKQRTVRSFSASKNHLSIKLPFC